MISAAKNIGSELLARWAKWEYSLRTLIKIERMRNQGKSNASAQLPEFMNQPDFLIDHTEVIETWKTLSDPLKAEKYLDQYRIDFLRSEGQNYSFSVEELVAYMLELRIHYRYARLSLDEGRKIIEEVTAL
jgi:hypothetical protein